MFGEPPLVAATRAGQTDEVRRLIAAGADVEATDKDLLSPLVLAAERGHYDVVVALVEAGADVNRSEGGHWTVLHGAAAQAPVRQAHDGHRGWLGARGPGRAADVAAH